MKNKTTKNPSSSKVCSSPLPPDPSQVEEALQRTLYAYFKEVGPMLTLDRVILKTKTPLPFALRSIVVDQSHRHAY